MKTFTHYSYRETLDSGNYPWAVFHNSDVKNITKVDTNEIIPIASGLTKDEAIEMIERFQKAHDLCESN